jgi:hypothetical protein
LFKRNGNAQASSVRLVARPPLLSKSRSDTGVIGAMSGALSRESQCGSGGPGQPYLAASPAGRDNTSYKQS